MSPSRILLRKTRSKFVIRTMYAMIIDRSTVGQVIIDGLPDDVLLQIFHFCRPPEPHSLIKLISLSSWSQSWKMLIQVCRRWRYTILGSPQRLRLRVLCTPTTPTRMLLNIWPPFPISIYSDSFDPRVVERGVENLTAAVEHRDRTPRSAYFK
jgi:F-box-like